MPDCPHGDAAHWPGDAGDVVDSLVPAIVRRVYPGITPPVYLWLRSIGALQ